MTATPGITGAVVLRNPTTGAAVYGPNNTATPPNSIPTTAPGVTQPPNTTQAPAVFSSAAATNQINTKIIPAMNDGVAAVSAQNAKVTATDPYQLLPGETVAAYTARIKALNSGTAAPQTSTAETKTSADQAAEDIANTPDSGNQFAYDAQGNKIQLPVGSPVPPGYSTTKPTSPVINKTPVQDSVSTANGTTYNQYSDGTYGQVDASGNYVGPITSSDFQTAKSNDPDTIASQIRASILSVANGSFPLTPTQQAQMNGLASGFASQIAQQAEDNANYTGGVTVAMNLYGMGNSISGLGTIKSTVDAGIAKITDLQGKQAAAVAAMQDSFEKDDMTALSTAYNAYSDAAKNIQTNIDNLRTYQEKVKTDAQTEAHQQFQDAISSENLTLAQKKQVFDQYMQKATLDEKTKNDAADIWIKQQTLDLQRGADAPTGPPVALNATGAPDAAGQAAFLAQYPATVQTQIKGLADYSLLPTSFPTRAAKGEMDRATAVALAKQYDPTYDESSAAARQAMQKNITSGSYSQTIVAANTLIGHLQKLQTDYAKLGNKSIPSINGAMNALNSATGSGAPTAVNTEIAAIASEAAKVYKGAGGTATDQEITDWKKNLSAAASPEQMQTAIQTITELMGSKLSTVASDYSGVMGKPAGFQILTTQSAAALQKMGIDPSSVDPTFGNDPTTKVSNFYNAAPGNAKAIDTIMQAAPDATPQEVIDQLNQAGYDL